MSLIARDIFPSTLFLDLNTVAGNVDRHISSGGPSKCNASTTSSSNRKQSPSSHLSMTISSTKDEQLYHLESVVPGAEYLVPPKFEPLVALGLSLFSYLRIHLLTLFWRIACLNQASRSSHSSPESYFDSNATVKYLHLTDCARIPREAMRRDYAEFRYQ